MFELGGSSNEDEGSFEKRMSFQASGSSLTVGLKRPSVDRQTTSFKEEIEARVINNQSHQDEDVFETDDEDDSDGAIEDEEEDDDDWEDSASESEEPQNENALFQRIDSRANLVSRRSMLTTMMHESDRAAAMVDMATKMSSKSRPQVRASALSGAVQNASNNQIARPEAEDRSRAKPIIMTATTTMPIALSPRTTRRNMLASELTESLRGHLLHERHIKQAISKASKKGLERRHTAQGNLSKLQEYPQAVDPCSKNNSWNDYFDQGLGDFNERGW